MPMRNPAVFARIFNTPLMIQSMKLDAIIAGLGPRFGLELPKTDMVLTASGEWKRPGYQVIGTIAVIDIFGVLAHRMSFDGNTSEYILGYDVIAKRLDAALNDAAVTGILLQIDSPGGEVAGCFELAQLIHDAQAQKPIHCVISSLAASAAYLLASACAVIGISDTGMAGSIGVVMRHVDVSQMAEKEGIKVTHIFAGAQKIDGNQFEPLSKAVKAKFQDNIDALYEQFISAVSSNRGLSAPAVRGQEAGIYTGTAAIQAGLADRIATPDQMLAAMQQQFKSIPRGSTMAATTEAVSENDTAIIKAKAEAFEAGKREGASAERQRMSAILNHDTAIGREAQAKALALDTDLAPDVAAKVLAASPISAASAQPVSQFGEHMTKLGNPTVGADQSDADVQAQADNYGWDKAFAKVTPIRGNK